MEEITFEDILVHYEGKLRETSEEIENIKNLLRNCVGSSEGSWSGNAAEAFRSKMEGVNAELTKAYGQLSEAMTKLTVIHELLAEDEA